MSKGSRKLVFGVSMKNPERIGQAVTSAAESVAGAVSNAAGSVAETVTDAVNGMSK